MTWKNTSLHHAIIIVSWYKSIPPIDWLAINVSLKWLIIICFISNHNFIWEKVIKQHTPWVRRMFITKHYFQFEFLINHLIIIFLNFLIKFSKIIWNFIANIRPGSQAEFFLRLLDSAPGSCVMEKGLLLKHLSNRFYSWNFQISLKVRMRFSAESKPNFGKLVIIVTSRAERNTDCNGTFRLTLQFWTLAKYTCAFPGIGIQNANVSPIATEKSRKWETRKVNLEFYWVYFQLD